MRRASRIFFVGGVVLLAASVLWAIFAPGRLVKFPSDLDKTAVARGTLQLYTDPATAAPLAQPRSLPVAIRRHVRAVGTTGNQVTVDETSVEQAGPAAPLQLRQRYVFDRSSMKSVPGSQSFSYTPENVVDRSPAYTINLPFGTGDGPYSVWKNETGRAYEFARAGDDVKRDGLTLIPLTGRLDNAPATAAYIAQLAPLGIPRQLTIEQLAPQLKALGLDVAALQQTVLPELTAADGATVGEMLAAPVPLRYFVSVRTRLLVEPATGAIVSLDRIAQTLSATPDVSGLADLVPLLSQSRYRDSKPVQATLKALGGISVPEPAKVFDLTYGQTPASVADFAAYATGKADDIRTVEKTIPGVIALLGVLCLGGALVTARRRQAVHA